MAGTKDAFRVETFGLEFQPDENSSKISQLRRRTRWFANRQLQQNVERAAEAFCSIRRPPLDDRWG